MKKTLLFTKQNSNNFYLLLVCYLCFNFGWSQTNLTLNSTFNEYTLNTTDNADGWDMTPNSTVQDNSGATITSPYRYDATNNPNGWNNSALDTWLSTSTNPVDGNEQPGSTSEGNQFGPKAGAGRGIKLYSPARRIYQKVPVTSGVNYTLFIDSRSEWVPLPDLSDQVTSEVFILNTEIADEVGLTSGSSTVDGYKLINNDHNPNSSSSTENTFTTNTITFTATNNFVVIYVRAPLSNNSGDKDVFYDNIELYTTASLSTKDVLASKLNIYPNPAKDYITVESKSVKISSVAMYNLLGAQVISEKALINSRLNVSGLAKGIYMLKVNAEGASTTKKIVIE